MKIIHLKQFLEAHKMVLTSKTRLGKRKLEIKEVRKEKQVIASKKHDNRGGFGYLVDCYLAQILVVECRLKRQKCCRL